MSEYAVLDEILNLTKTALNPYLTAAGLPNVVAGNVRLGSIDPSIQAQVVIWIQPGRTEFETGSISEDNAGTSARVFLLFRGLADATLWANMMKTAAFYREMICDNDTLGGDALHATVAYFEYFDTVEGAPEVRAVEIGIQVSHEEPRG